MDLFIIIAAAVVAWVAGALWYMMLSGPWVRVSGIQVDNTGKPVNKSPLPYLVSGIAMVVVAAAMNWLFGLADVDTLLGGAGTGFVIGALIVTPWVLIDNSYVSRPLMLTVIDGGYATLACTLIGTILGAT
ncbi:DUF1761 domain-containing protein [Paracoccus sp. SCSIO 75233]|uniref:DUF1761 domain-containing protein n=1 Tax=Paracoccus sp. SCSIO 75233 TaxID=3017782 RepID=UPI0022F0936A|nr:DUF1761 domain-containing protein [Paracoccus sp. SCSIO 75233]WBU53525.1 DUF1761 domain-containing protein [Paracoccus sp. SCSIO 75233]